MWQDVGVHLKQYLSDVSADLLKMYFLVYRSTSEEVQPEIGFTKNS